MAACCNHSFLRRRVRETCRCLVQLAEPCRGERAFTNLRRSRTTRPDSRDRTMKSAHQSIERTEPTWNAKQSSSTRTGAVSTTELPTRRVAGLPFSPAASTARRSTKNNRMELKAAIEATKQLKVPCDVTIVTDSQYVCRCFSSIREWYNNGWRNKSGGKPANLDLLKELMDIGVKGHHKFRFQYVEGHSGHPENERCDQLARAEAHAVLKFQAAE